MRTVDIQSHKNIFTTMYNKKKTDEVGSRKKNGTATVYICNLQNLNTTQRSHYSLGILKYIHTNITEPWNPSLIFQ